MRNDYQRKILKNKILNASFQSQFDEDLALEIFAFQYAHNTVYNQYCDFLRKTPCNVQSILHIPFLPISFFKTRKILCQGVEHHMIFKSSGTTGMDRSSHYIADVELYNQCSLNGFKSFYGEPSSYAILALLPSYLEQKNSSLVHMTSLLIELSNNEFSGFFLKNLAELQIKIAEAKQSGLKVLLLGVTYALLDLADVFDTRLSENLIIMETGGMKGRRKEMIKEELHSVLKSKFGVNKIHSEYGMTELLSQAYSMGEGRFYPSNTMKILIRDTYDPLSYEDVGRTGGLNIIDLANLDSCSFIATQDLGKVFSDRSFEIAGRFDQSDIRGCNLLVES